MNLKDQQHLRKIRRGDLQAFETLFHRFYPGLCGYAGMLLRKEEVAEEVVQDVFYNIWKNRETMKLRTSWQNYLYRAVYNNSMMYLRKNRLEFPMDQRLAGNMEGGADPYELLKLQEMKDIVTMTLDRLPEKTREIFRLNRQEGLKYREIAERLSISVKTVEAHMGRALKALRTNLDKYATT